MTSRDFCYWLQGLFEDGRPETLDAEAVDCIRRHLNLVFVHEIDPSMGDKQHQQILQEVHDGKTQQSKPPSSFGPKPPRPQTFRC